LGCSQTQVTSSAREQDEERHDRSEPWGRFPHGLSGQAQTKEPDLVWALIASLYVGNVMLLLLNLPLVRRRCWRSRATR
jgi:hypothetical protein